MADTYFKLLTKIIKFMFLCRFDGWSSEASSTTEEKNSNDNGYHGRKLRPSVSAVLDSIKRRLEDGSDKIKNLRKSSTVHPISDRPPKTLAPEKKILDPHFNYLYGSLIIFSKYYPSFNTPIIKGKMTNKYFRMYKRTSRELKLPK